MCLQPHHASNSRTFHDILWVKLGSQGLVTLRDGSKGDKGFWAFLPRPQILVSHSPDMEMVPIKDLSHDAGHGHPDIMAQGVVGKGYKVLGGHLT